MKINAIMFVATATCGSIPNAIITGTVMRDVLPVTTLMTLVMKKTATRMSDLSRGTPSIVSRLCRVSSVVVCDLEPQEVMDRIEGVLIHGRDADSSTSRQLL